MAAFLTMAVRGATQAHRRMTAAAAIVRAEQLRAMRLSTIYVERVVKENFLTGSPGSHPLFGRTGAKGATLGAVTGHLRRSVTSTAFSAHTGTGFVVVGTVGTAVPYAKAHEEGATIRGNPWLRIPTKFAKKRSGEDRLAGVSARSDRSLFVVQSKKGNLWLVRMPGSAKKLRERAAARALAGERHPSAGARGTKHRSTRKFWPGLVPMYLLVKSVTLRPRRSFHHAMERSRSRVVRIMGIVGQRVSATAGGA